MAGIGRRAAQTHVRAVPVVPIEKQKNLPAKPSPRKRDYWQQPNASSLERADETLAHGDAPGLADGAFAVADSAPPAPGPEVGTSKLRARIGDKVFGRCANLCDEAAEKLADLLGSRLLLAARLEWVRN
jgi:hypothetical protein